MRADELIERRMDRPSILFVFWLGTTKLIKRKFPSTTVQLMFCALQKRDIFIGIESKTMGFAPKIIRVVV